MDNLTHTLIGAVAGEALAHVTARTHPPPSSAGAAPGLPGSTRRGLLVLAGVLGSNLPDVDVAWTWRGGFAGSNLAYLLEHRGHTHTLVGCAALALLLHAGLWLWWRARGLQASARDHCVIAGMALCGVFGHLGMDALNNYGVHPFWPWNDRWYYGDALFIVEPLYWLAALPLCFLWRRPVARIGLGLVVALALAVALFVHRSAPVQCAGVVLAAAALAGLGWRGTPRVAACGALATMLLVTGGFVLASHVAAAGMRVMAAAAFPDAVTLDTVLTPGPAQPGCWDVLLLQTEAGSYVGRHAMMALGSRADVAGCSRLQQWQGGTAPLQPVAAPSSPGLEWAGEFSQPVARFAELAATDCAARELLQFARAPFAVLRADRWVVGDLRFDRQAGIDFSEVELPPSRDTPCRFDAPWVPPRADLLTRR